MRWPRLKLRWQLLISYLPVMLIPVIGIGLVVRNVAENGLTVLVTQEAQQRAVTVSGVFAQYYRTHGSWTGVESLFEALNNNPNPPRQQPGGAAVPLNGQGQPRRDNPPPGLQNPKPGQILITDLKGVVVASENDTANGQTLSADALAHGAAIMVNGQSVGTLVVGSALGVLGAQENQLLDTVSSALALTGLLTSAVVVALVLWLSAQLTAPMRDLMRGVRQLASGHWSEPLKIRSQNEFADLTHAFNNMAAQLTQQQEQQRQMIADIAHDLRTPLSVMALEVAGIRAGLQSPKEATSSLQEEIDWLQHLIDDLHTLSLLDTGRFTLQLDNVALTPYLCAVGDQWQAMAAAQNKTLVCDVPADLPIVALDPFRMRQVLGNLLNNAVQHTPPGTQITLRACASGDGVAIQVRDSGPGIAPDDLTHLFERFYRADRARNRGHHEHGSGLGLSIAYQLVALHGATLSVESTLGAGATFQVRLRLSAA